MPIVRRYNATLSWLNTNTKIHRVDWILLSHAIHVEQCQSVVHTTRPQVHTMQILNDIELTENYYHTQLMFSNADLSSIQRNYELTKYPLEGTETLAGLALKFGCRVIFFTCTYSSWLIIVRGHWDPRWTCPSIWLSSKFQMYTYLAAGWVL